MGTVPENGVINIITGEIYALFGKNGGKGGAGAGKTDPGESIEFEGITYNPGEYGQSNVYTGEIPDGNQSAAGGCGGGPAIAANGKDGSDGEIRYNKNHGFAEGGNGGAGADADSALPVLSGKYGTGGNGGNGGGGGGAGGTASNSNGDIYDSNGESGTGGKGGQGSQGGPGALIIYY